MANGLCLHRRAQLGLVAAGRDLRKSRFGSLRETLNPNLVGWFAKSLVSRVDLPTPDGPDSTSGLRKSEAMVVEDIVSRIQRLSAGREA